MLARMAPTTTPAETAESEKHPGVSPATLPYYAGLLHELEAQKWAMIGQLAARGHIDRITHCPTIGEIEGARDPVWELSGVWLDRRYLLFFKPVLTGADRALSEAAGAGSSGSWRVRRAGQTDVRVYATLDAALEYLGMETAPLFRWART